MFRDPLPKDRRVYGFEKFLLGGVPQVAGIHGNEHVGRRPAALRLDPLDERAGVVGDKPDGDPCLAFIFFEQGLDKVLVAGRVDDQLTGLGLDGHCKAQ